VKPIADSISQQVTSKNFERIAEENDLQIKHTNMITKSSYIRDIGKVINLNEAILNLKEPGKITKLIKGENGFYLAKLIEYKAPDMNTYKKKFESLKQNLVTQQENKNYNEWFEHAKQAANIKDRRGKFFRL